MSRSTRPPPPTGDADDDRPLGPDENPFGDAPVVLPLDGTLDLHLFHPREVKDVVLGYLEGCREAGVLTVRVVHGKGSGALRRGVQALLARMPEVERAWPAEEKDGGWGVTWVRLRPASHGPPAAPGSRLR